MKTLLLISILFLSGCNLSGITQEYVPTEGQSMCTFETIKSCEKNNCIVRWDTASYEDVQPWTCCPSDSTFEECGL